MIISYKLKCGRKNLLPFVDIILVKAEEGAIMKVNSKKLVKQLDEKWKDVKCPYCSEHKWTVDPTIMTLFEVDENMEVNIGGKFQPLIPVTCRCCGNTTFVNALILDCIDEGREG